LIGEIPQQDRADRLMIAVEGCCVETAVGFDPPSVLAEFHDIVSHINPA
jgi:hypothetical protein